MGINLSKAAKPEHVGLCVVIFDSKQNKILLGERINSYLAGSFGLPGGRIEIWETITNALTRELQEETGIILNNSKYIGVVRELQKNSYTFIHFGFLVTSFEGKIENKEPNKCKGWKWYSLTDLPDNILPGHKAIIEIFKNPHENNYKDLR